jgi:hypothetical protein
MAAAKQQQTSALDQLKQSLSDAIDAFTSNRFKILQQAMNDGGQADVDKVLSEYDTLRDGYFQLIKTQLDENNAQYDVLTKQAKAETKSLQSDIENLSAVTTVIDDLTTVVNLVGRIIMVLGVA